MPPPPARILPVIELSLAAALLAGLALSHVRQAAAVAAIALLATFTFAMVRTLRRGQTPICQCFGSLGGRPIGVDSVVRNLALAALAAVVGLG